jgi:predicted enzyme related to lactoylglutathione lyase
MHRAGIEPVDRVRCHGRPGRARSFYEQVLGLAVTESDDHSCVFDVGGTMLRVTAVREVAWFVDPDGNTLSLTEFS